MTNFHPIYLTKNFSLDELIYSRTADVKGLDNFPEQPELDNLIYLCELILQPLRESVGPIHVTSGYRGPQLNKAIGGVDTSLHAQGLAVDIYSEELDNFELAIYIKDRFSFEELVLEKCPLSNPRKGWVHIAVKRESMSNEVMSFIKNKDNKYEYVWGLQFDKEKSNGTK